MVEGMLDEASFAGPGHAIRHAPGTVAGAAVDTLTGAIATPES